jgi:hypothetical protein
MLKTNVSILLLCAALTGCAESSNVSSGDVPTPSSSTLFQLQSGVELTVLPGVSTVTIDARWNRGNEWSDGSVELSLEGGHIALSANDFGVVEVSDIEINIGDVLVSSDQLGSDIQLTDVSVRQTKARDCDINDWSENRQTCSAWLQLGLLLDWSLVTDNGSVVPLGAQELVDIPMQIDLSSGPRGLEAQLRVDGEGALWTWANVVELHGLQLDIGADEIGPVD